MDAQLAEAKSRSGKARKAAGELQEGVRVLREELDRKNSGSPSPGRQAARRPPNAQ